MTSKADWQGKTGESWASHWARTDRSFTGLTDILLRRASAVSFAKAIDIGCGAGELSLALARGHPAAEIRGLDISEELVAVAARRGDYLANVTFGTADAAEWQDRNFKPDLVVSRHGVMFFDDPVAAFSNLRAAAADHARLVFSCFRNPSDNPWASKVASLVPASDDAPPKDPRAPGPFAFADDEYAGAILRDAGWREIAFEAIDFAFVVGAGEDPVSDAMAYFSVIGPAASAAAALDDTDKARFHVKLQRYLERHASGNIVALPAAAWIVTARKD